MNLAIVCPIGDLNRFGYWRTAQICLESWQAIGHLFLIHSSRTAMPFGLRCTYIRNEGTTMKMIDGAEWFDHHLVAHNANVGLEAARQQGYDVALTICVNWYAEQEQALSIFEKCQRLFECSTAYEFLYRRYQIGPILCDSDLKSIAMFNLRLVDGDAVQVLVDRVEVLGQTVESRRGYYAPMHPEAYIDCEFELTVDELKEKLADIRNYEDILPKRHGADWSYWERYYRARATHLLVSPDAPGPVGQRINQAHPRSAFGDWLINEMRAAA